jgi:hypothetical protein
VAEEAFQHKESKWMIPDDGRHFVFRSGDSVTWFRNNKLNKQCFGKMVAAEQMVGGMQP